MTECMTHGCEETASQFMRTEGFSYDDYRCQDHSSDEHIPIEEASESIQILHKKAMTGN